jgi:RimJ/RimL family protein N-acetyltransferase
VWVTESLRRQGLVRRMLWALEAQAREDAVHSLRLWILETNMAAAGAYERLGFSEVADSWQNSPKQRLDGSYVREFQMVKQLLS